MSDPVALDAEATIVGLRTEREKWHAAYDLVKALLGQETAWRIAASERANKLAVERIATDARIAGLTEERDALRAERDRAIRAHDHLAEAWRTQDARIARLEEALREIAASHDMQSRPERHFAPPQHCTDLVRLARNALSQDTESPRWDNADERSGRNAEGMGDTESPEEPA